MLLTSVVLILQETLEAALLISILAVVSLQLGRRTAWLPWALGAGIVLALIYAANLRRISEWFEYFGQELINAGLQIGIALLLVSLAWVVGRWSDPGPNAEVRPPIGFAVLCALTVALAITREGSEILVFLGGFFSQRQDLQPVLAGSAIGFGIGVSIGLLLFYGLLALGGRKGRWLAFVLLALFSGNMLSQAILQLMQADWLQGGQALWDSSTLIPEHSVAGRLLYALVGYESRPSTAQAIGYLAGTIAVLAAAMAGRRTA